VWIVLALDTWGLAGTVHDPRAAKRLFPLYGAAVILGGALGGLLTRPLVGWIHAENLLIVWAVSLGAPSGVAGAVARRGTGGGGEAESGAAAHPSRRVARGGGGCAVRAGIAVASSHVRRDPALDPAVLRALVAVRGRGHGAVPVLRPARGVPGSVRGGHESRR